MRWVTTMALLMEMVSDKLMYNFHNDPLFFSLQCVAKLRKLEWLTLVLIRPWSALSSLLLVLCPHSNVVLLSYDFSSPWLLKPNENSHAAWQQLTQPLVIDRPSVRALRTLIKHCLPFIDTSHLYSIESHLWRVAFYAWFFNYHPFRLAQILQWCLLFVRLCP